MVVPHGLRRAVVGTAFTIAGTVMAAALAFFRGGRLRRSAAMGRSGMAMIMPPSRRANPGDPAGVPRTAGKALPAVTLEGIIWA